MKFEETYIYKYCSLEVGELIISSQLLKFNNPSFFNDPFDCDINLLEFDFSDCCDDVLDDIEKLKHRVITKFSPLYKKQVAQIFDEIIKADSIEVEYKKSILSKIEKSRICCFSLKNDNITMWSHYADKHNGVCLVFDLNIIERFQDKEINRRMSSGMVEYKDLTQINYLADKREGINNLFFTKTKDWAYEEEIRLFILENDLKFIKFNREFLIGVIFGANVKDVEISKFQKTIEFSGFKHLSLARLKKENLKLGLEDISF